MCLRSHETSFRWRALPSLAEPLEPRRLLAVGLFADLDATPLEPPAAQPTTLGKRTFFVAEDSAGKELWVTDSTPRGTHRVKDLRPGPEDSSPFSLTPHGGSLYFFAQVGGEYYSLWKTDGTDAGTRLVKSFPHGYASGQMASAGKHLFFTAPLGTADDYRNALWTTDGSPKGTRPFTKGLPQNATLGLSLIPFRGRVLFNLQTAPAEFEESRQTTPPTYQIWQSDGTRPGTRPLSNQPVAFSENYFETARMHRALYFMTESAAFGTELWKTNLTQTRIVRDINPGPPSSNPYHLTRFGRDLFFSATTRDAGQELWATDGSRTGTRLIKDLNPGGEFHGSPTGLKTLDGVLYFSTDNFIEPGTDAGYAQPRSLLWKSDGTSAGTRLVQDPRTTDEPGFWPVASINKRLIFFRTTPEHGSELWTGDGTASGTRLIADVHPGPTDGYRTSLGTLNNRFLFLADDPAGRGVWSTDGTRSGTRLLRRFDATPTESANPRLFLETEDGLYYSTDAGLWITDGTPNGHRLVHASRDPIADVIPLGDRVFFTTLLTTGNGYDAYKFLWRLDPATGVVTRMVPDEGYYDLSYYSPYQDPALADGTPVVFDGELYHRGFGGWPGLWKTDGKRFERTHVTEEQVADTLFVHGDGLYFSTYTALHRIDATTDEVTTLLELPDFSRQIYSPFFAINDRVVFSIGGDFTDELWSTDGTPQGTTQIDTFYNVIYGAHAFQGALLFAGESSDGTGLWRTDGTAEGTRFLHSIPRPPFGGWIDAFTTLGDAVYFLRYDGRGPELWRTDGTSAGTGLITHVGDSEFAFANGMTAFDGRLYIALNDGIHGIEPWVSDGTAEGTRLLLDLSPGPGSSDPRNFLPFGDRLLFTADHPLYGREIWQIT